MGILKFRKSVILFMLPAFIIYLMFFGYSFVRTVYYSFFEWDGLMKPVFIGFKNYIQLAKDQLFIVGLGRISIWALTQIIFKVGIALMLANMLRRPIKGSKLFTSIYFIPVVISTAAIALMFTLIYDLDIGALNALLKAIGLGAYATSWLGNEKTAFYSIVFVHIFHNIGYFFIILLAGMQDISEDLYESAKIDGANAWITFTKITIPQLWLIIQICIILAITGAMKSFDYVYIMTKGGPGTLTQVPATYMYETTFVGMRFGYGTTIAFAIFLFSLLITVVFRKLTNFETN